MVISVSVAIPIQIHKWQRHKVLKGITDESFFVKKLKFVFTAIGNMKCPTHLLLGALEAIDTAAKNESPVKVQGKYTREDLQLANNFSVF